MIGDNKSIIIFRLQNETQGKKVIIRPARKVLTTIFSEQTIRPNYLLLETARKNQSFFFFQIDTSPVYSSPSNVSRNISSTEVSNIYSIYPVKRFSIHRFLAS